MRQFFYPSGIAVFGVTDSPENLGKNIIVNCQEAGFEGTERVNENETPPSLI